MFGKNFDCDLWMSRTLRPRLVLRKESGEMENEMVKMESRANDGKVKFVGLVKVWDWERELIGPRIYVNYPKIAPS